MAGIHFREARAPAGMRLYAIGDVHGRLDLLSAMHRAIATEIARDRPADWRIVHLGDYIDRGPDSKGVLDFVIAARRRDPRNMLLTGNHEAGLLDFLASPEDTSLFVRFGGVETARSYGVDLLAGGTMAQGRNALIGAIPGAHLETLADLPSSVELGDFFFCHAGVRPGVPLDRQSLHDLIWIRDDFLDHAGLHPKLIVHGHTPQPEPQVLPNRVNVDTRAYASGRLTSLAVDGADKHILTAWDDGSVQRVAAVTP